MQRFQFALAAALAAALIPAAAGAQVESTPVPAPMKPNFSAFRFMAGTWSCSTMSSRRPKPFVTTVTYSFDASGYWMNSVSSTAKTAWIPIVLRNWDKTTYDNDAHRWVDVGYGDGGSYALSYSKGWEGNTISWHDTTFAAGPDIASQTDNVITKVSDTKTTSASSFTETKSGRKVSVKGVCTKQ